MTARDLKALKDALGLDAWALAEVLGVHVSSVYRWEAAKGILTFETAVARILEPLHERRAGSARLAQLGRDAREGMIKHGPLGGLHVIIGFLLESK